MLEQLSHESTRGVGLIVVREPLLFGIVGVVEVRRLQDEDDAGAARPSEMEEGLGTSAVAVNVEEPFVVTAGAGAGLSAVHLEVGWQVLGAHGARISNAWVSRRGL